MSLRLFPGAALQGSLRALVLGPLAAPLTGVLRGPEGERALPLTALRTSAALGAALARAEVQVALATVEGLCADTAYQVTVRAGDLVQSAALRTLPAALPAEGLGLCWASCYYDGYNGDHGYRDALLHARQQGPLAFKILGGDNLYLDVGPGQARHLDAYQETLERYLLYFLRSGYAEVLATLPTLCTFDDHDFWNNYPEAQPHLLRSLPPLRQSYQAAARDALALFQLPLNPPGVDGGPGYSFSFDVAPVSFFVADTRGRRSHCAAPQPQLLPAVELQALEAWAAGLKGPGVLVLGQPLWLDAGDWRDHNLAAFGADYGRILRALCDAPYEIVVLSGDVHHSRALRLALPGERRLFELVSSPANHLPSEVSVLGGLLGMGAGAQAESAVRLPERVALAAGFEGCKPALAEYYFGCTAPRSIGLLRLWPAPDGVAVGCTFLDTRTGRPAAVAQPVTPLRVAPSPARECHSERLFTLRRR